MAVEIEGSVTPFRVAADNIPTVVIANRNDIERVRIGILLDAGGYRVAARCSHEHELLRFVETLSPNVILVADNIAHQRAAETVGRLRAGNCSGAIILLLEERQAITAADLLNLNVDGILLSAGCVRSIIDCFENVLHGRKWVDPDLLRHLAMEEQRSQLASSLTTREAEVAHLASQGLRNKEIARELHRHREDVLASYLREASPQRQNAAGTVDGRSTRHDETAGLHLLKPQGTLVLATLLPAPIFFLRHHSSIRSNISCLVAPR